MCKPLPRAFAEGSHSLSTSGERLLSQCGLNGMVTFTAPGIPWYAVTQGLDEFTTTLNGFDTNFVWRAPSDVHVNGGTST